VAFAAGDALSGIASSSDPITVQSEGKGQVITGNASDRAGNTTSLNVLVNLDKTPPEALSTFEAVSHDVVLNGSDVLSGVAATSITPSTTRHHHYLFWTTELRTYAIFDLAGNSLVVREKVTRTRRSISVRIASLQYNNRTNVNLGRNKQKFEWRLGTNGNLIKLEQECEAGTGPDKQKIDAVFNAKKKNETLIREVLQHSIIPKPGIAILRSETEKGKLTIRF
jgi:hypothetical protein